MALSYYHQALQNAPPFLLLWPHHEDMAYAHMQLKQFDSVIYYQQTYRHNLELFEKMHPHYRDRKRLIAVVKAGRQQLEEQMAQERAEAAERRKRGEERIPGWDADR